ncbi:MAG: molybdopterin-synthase adenylyltransferase MoeB [Candidatus Eisenbacteria bacterium]|uniref:Molybdopterin-synthase adenylyltransferase MoeB n=1 Tax=Eiseniibacteriota bacterium TaxID=2212470 RepID=A0A948RSN1_UNCEI|nr:molybdopterin-synthase adenylyltransferase MoeB [Candidatus Eisenbacteria bacterium]MBU1950766.1 molybdopterin-synthase adenylyltransferase MoeB [Candidatus Eisenbacteria bacterium]MBU2690150.1 molybdopterin-synthase adenylyltransferase MoeB [Candidatus Eisenbacteria bacterium]
MTAKWPSWAVARDISNVQLTHAEVARYSRHLILPEMTITGQKRLKAGSVLCVGTGGLGSPLALYLAATGVGRIGLVDLDVVDASNLQRQILHGTRDIDRPKLESAKETLQDINPHVQIDCHETFLNSENALEIIKEYDVIADGTDNFPARYLINDACVLLKKPDVYGGIFRFEGQVSVFFGAEGPCYRCLYPEPPPPGLAPSCMEAGVMGILPGVIGLIQATEVVKLLTGLGEPLIGRLLLYDALPMTFREIRLSKNKKCGLCGDEPTQKELIDYEQFCGITQIQNDQETLKEVRRMAAVMLRRLPVGTISGEGPVIDPASLNVKSVELKRRLDAGDPVVVLDVREPQEAMICSIPQSRLMSLEEISLRYKELDPKQETYVYCKGGVRSWGVALFLAQMGFDKVYNLEKGIVGWAEEVDPTMPKY